MRRRSKSWVPRSRAMERRPLWPASPPPRRACRRPSSRSTSSWTTSTDSGGTLKNRAAAAIDRPDSFMYVSGFSRARRAESSRISASWPENFDRQEPPCRRASSSTTIHPTLWRVRAYSRPGLPRAGASAGARRCPPPGRGSTARSSPRIPIAWQALPPGGARGIVQGGSDSDLRPVAIRANHMSIEPRRPGGRRTHGRCPPSCA